MKYTKFLKAIALLLWPFALAAQDKPELVITTGHTTRVTSVDYHPGGAFVLTAGDDRTVRIWDRGLQQEFRTMYGHINAVKKAIFSPDGNLIASSDNKEVIVRKFPSGEIVQKIQLERMSGTLAFTADSKGLFIEGEDRKLVIVDAITGAKKQAFGIEAEDEMVLNAATGKVFTRCREGCDTEPASVAVIDMASGKQEKVLKGGKGNINELVCSSDGKWVAAYVMSPKSNIYVWDAKSAALKSTVELPAGVYLSGLAFAKDGSRIYTIARDSKIRIYSASSGKLEKEIVRFIDYTQVASQKGTYELGIGMYAVSLSPDGKQLAVAVDYMQISPDAFGKNASSVMMWNTETNKQTGELAGMQRTVRGLWGCKKQPYVITANSNPLIGTKFWNMKDGSVQTSVQALGISDASKGGDTISVFEGGRVSVRLVPGYEELMAVDSTAVWGTAISGDGKMLIVGTANFKNPAKPRSFIGVWNVADKKLLKKIEIGYCRGDKRIWITPNKKHFMFECDKPVVFEIASGKQVAEIPTQDYRILGLSPAGATVLMAPHDMDGIGENVPVIVEYDLLTGKETARHTLTGFNGIVNAIEFSSDGSRLAVGGGGFAAGYEPVAMVYDWKTKSPLCKLKGHEAPLLSVSFGDKSNILYSASEDGTVKAWNTETCSETGTMIGMRDLDYILFDPDNYYKSSKGNYSGICFRMKGKLYTFEQFDMVYNRPDIVMAKFGAPKPLVSMYKLAWKKRITRAGFTEEALAGVLGELPSVDLPLKTSIPPATDQGLLKLKVKASGTQSDLDRVNVYVNEVPVFGINGYSLKGKSLKEFEQEMSIELSPGKNFVQVSAINSKGLESLRESFDIECTKAAEKPDLYILAVGISKYKEQNFNLKYSSKDMNDFVNMMQSSGMYNKIYVKKIQDTLATKENIIAEGKIFEQARVTDRVIAYFSSHGLLDEKLDYYLATTDVNFTDPSARGLPYDEIEKMFDKCRSRSRLVLIDACHSGEVDKDDLVAVKNDNGPVKGTKAGTISVKPKAGLKNSFSYMQALFSDVSKGSGTVVISAAAGAEFALESQEWNNGVFTYSIMKGIKSGEADANKDKIISITEMKNYVITTVTELTKGAQVPTVRKENYANDFVIYKK
jgi:WD40 repeat protein